MPRSHKECGISEDMTKARCDWIESVKGGLDIGVMRT